MEKQLHTPGPWYAGIDTRAHAIKTHEVRSQDGMLIAMVAGRHEGEVNASLVATAPELLALAKRALPILQHAINRDPVGVWSDAAIKLEHDALAAIAKAEGRA